jgi:hypothetical protein
MPNPAKAVFGLFLLVGGCGPRESDLADCVANGVAYFKEIGSYPTLASAPNKGRKAEVVARERCERTPGAFPPRSATP